MYILSVEEIFEHLDQIITSLEETNESVYSIVIEIAHQMKDELADACED